MPSIASHIEAALFLIRPKSATPTQLAKYVGCSRKTACRLLHDARNAGACHIIGWCEEHQRERNSWTPRYAHGAGDNTPKPDPLSSAERLQQSKARKMRRMVVPEGILIINRWIIASYVP